MSCPRVGAGSNGSMELYVRRGVLLPSRVNARMARGFPRGDRPLLCPRLARLGSPCLASLGQAGIFPESEAADKGVGVLAQLALARTRVEFVGVAAADDDVVGLDRGRQALDDIVDVSCPFPFAVALQSGGADEILETFTPAVRQVREL